MSLTSFNANVALQLDKDYLETVVMRYVAFNTNHCIPSGGPFPLPSQQGRFLEAVGEVTFELTGVSFSYDGTQTIAEANISVVDGTLRVGTDPSNLQPVSSTTIPFPLDISRHNNRNNVLVVSVNIPLRQSPQFEFDLSALSGGAASFTLPNDPARLTVLSDGSVAAGVTFKNSPKSDLSSFASSYADTKVSGANTDWALVLDEWTVTQFVDAMNLANSNKNLRKTDMDLDRIDASGLRLSVDGESKLTANINGSRITSWWDFCAGATATASVANPGTKKSNLRTNYTVNSARLCKDDSWANFAVNVKKKLRKKGYATGTIDVLSPVQFGQQSDPAGRFVGQQATTASGELVVTGTGTKQPPRSPSVSVSPSSLEVINHCGSNTPAGRFRVSNTASGTHAAPLNICAVELVGNASNFTLSGGPAANNGDEQVPAGQSTTYTVTYTGSATGPVKATARVVTNDGVETVTLRGYPAVGTIQVPGSLDLRDAEEIIDCSCGSLTDATDHVQVTNVGNGPVEICDVTLSNTQGGSWSTGGLSKGDVLFPGDGEPLSVTFDANTLDTWFSATLDIETSGNDETVNLRGRVDDTGDEGIPAQHYADGCTGGVVIGGHNVCYTAEGIYVANQVIQNTIDMLFDDGRLGGDLSIWEGLLPECGPRMLCRDFMEVHVDGLPEDFLAEFTGIDETPRYRYRATAGTTTMFVPMDGEPVQMHQEVAGDVADREVTGHLKAWRLQRTGTIETDQPLTGVDVVGDRVVALADDIIRVFAVDSRGIPEESTAYDLELSLDGLVGLGNLFAVHGDEGVVLLGPAGEEFQVLGDFELSASLLLPAADLSSRQRYVYAVHDDHISLIDLTDPSKPDFVWTVEECVDVEPTTGFVTTDRLLLAGDEGVAGWEITPEGLHPAGRLPLDDVVSVFGGEDQAYVIQSSGEASILELTPNGGLEKRGDITFPEEWTPVLPYGRPSVLDGHAVARRLDCQGFNVLQLRQGAYEPGETDVEPGRGR